VLITEEDLLCYQTCPKKYSLLKEYKLEEPISVTFLQQAAAIWMWTHQIIHKKKCTDRALKEKWANLVMTTRLKQPTSHSIATTDILADGYSLVRDLYVQYLDSVYQPIATMFPTRYTIPHIGTVLTTAHVITVNDLGNCILLNYANNTSVHNITSSLIYKIKL
jgi:hypothetical protein